MQFNGRLIVDFIIGIETNPICGIALFFVSRSQTRDAAREGVIRQFSAERPPSE